MIALLPLPGPELPPWSDPLVRRALRGMAEQAARTAGVELLLLGADEHAWPELGGLEGARFLPPGPDPAPQAGEDRWPLPPGSRRLAGAAAAQGLLPDAPALFLDCRNPLVDAPLLEAALERLARGGGETLVTVRHCADHPCQLRASFRIVDMRLLHLFEPGQPATGELRTGVFRRSWSARDAQDDPELLPVAAGGMVTHHARLVLDRRKLGQDLSALGLALHDGLLGATRPEPGAGFAAVAEAAQEGCRLEVRPARPLPLGGELHAVPLGPGGALAGQSRSAAVRPPGAVGLDAPLPPGCTAFLLVLTARTQDPAFDFALPLTPEGAGWHFRPDDMRLCRTDTGQEIVGRQNFPEVFEPAPAFCICRPGADPATEIAQGGAELLLLPRSHSVHVLAPLDLLRLRARLEDRAHA